MPVLTVQDLDCSLESVKIPFSKRPTFSDLFYTCPIVSIHAVARECKTIHLAASGNLSKLYKASGVVLTDPATDPGEGNGA